MERVSLSKAISKAEFHSRLRAWFRDTEDIIVGDASEIGVKAWVHALDGDLKFRLNVDTKRKGVADHLQLVEQDGHELEWTVVANQQGKENAVAYGPQQVRLKSFYLYLVDPA
jgi:hypothetical protein